MSYRAQRQDQDVIEPFAWEAVAAAAAPPAVRRLTPADLGPATSLPPGVDLATHLASLEREAFAKGYEQGERSGAEAAATRTEGTLRRMAQTIDELANLRGEIIRRTERQTVQLILAIAERVVHREVTLDRGLLVGMARAALDRLGEYGSATLRLHPADLKAMGLESYSFEGAPVQIVSDPVVSRGGCLVQSDFGFMDVTPEAQFRELARALLSDGEVSQPETESSRVITGK